MSDESQIGSNADLLDQARKIKLFLMDVDGTLTDGSILLTSGLVAETEGDPVVYETKTFNAKDGPGLSLAHAMGIQTGFITGRRSPAATQRAHELKVTWVYLGQSEKTEAFLDCIRKAGVSEEEVAYMGDDLPDIPIARRVGLAICVADGAQELKDVCHYVTQKQGGRGTAREVVELILKAQGRWDEALPLARA